MKTAHTTSYADGGSTNGLKMRLTILAALLALTTASVTSHAAAIAHWTFDELGGTVAHDRAGGLDGTLSPTGAGFVAGGISSNAISLSQAANGFVNMGNVLSLTSGDFSVVVWVKMNVGDTSPNTIILSKHHSSYVNGYLVLVNQGGGGGQNNKACFYAGGLVADGPVSKTSVNDGNWHQVVGVYKSGVNKLIYVDGVVEATNSAPAIDGNDAAFLIGGLNQGGVPASRFTGLIDDVQVYNQALGSSDILYLFQNPGKVLAIPSSPCAPAPAGLVSWWRGETNALDQTGTNHGTLSGNITYGAGRVGQGFGFDGNGAVVQLGNPASLRLQDLTIETWLRRTSPSVVSFNGGPGNGVIFGYDNGGYGLYLDPSGVPTFSKIGFNEVKPGIAITDTNWHHVVVTKVGSTVVFYLDGVAYPAAAYDPGFTFSGNAYLGGLGSFYTFYGNVDEVSVYSRALATNEIQGLYVAGSAGKCLAVAPPSCTQVPTGLVSWWRGESNAQDHAGTNNGILTGNATYATGQVNQAFVLDGVTGSVNIPASPGLNVGLGDGFSIEAWIKPEDIANAQPLVEWFGDAGPPWGVHFWISEAGSGPGPGCLYVNVMDQGGGEHKFASVAGIVGTNRWQHVAMTYDKATGIARLFYNGAVVAAQFLGSYTPQTSYPLFLGKRPPGTYSGVHYRGSMDEVSIYRRALTTNEIQTIYGASVAGKCVPAPPVFCTATPSGLVSWWRGETNALDQTGTNNGTLAGNTTYGAGRVGEAFVFDGNGDGVLVGNPASLQLQNFTIETWIKRGSSSVVSYGTYGDGLIFGYGYGGYGLYIDHNGIPGLGKLGISGVTPSATIGDTNLHHLVVTKSGSVVVFYIDGVGYSAAAYDPGFSFSTIAAIGQRGDNLDNSFLGVIDEVSVYNRALLANEIQAIYNAGGNGKCLVGSLPAINVQSVDQTVTVGETATFSVTASGTAPLSYQWRLNTTNIAGASAATLVLTNVQPAAAGVYSVVVSNPIGTVTSSNATLTVNPLLACIHPAAGLVSWWSGNGNANDLVGVNHGIFNNGATFGVGEVGQGFSFNGGSNNVRIPATPSLDVGKSNGMTIEAWIKPAGTGQYPIVEWAPGGAYGPLVWINVLGPGSVYADLFDSNGQEHLFQSAAGVIVPNVFQHLAVTYDKVTGMGRIFVNGVVVAEANLGSFTPLTSSDLYIGYRPPSAPFGPIPFSGIIDEVSLYARALSLGEVQAVYTAGSDGKCAPVLPSTCAPTPAGLVSWWRSEANALDQAGTNNGTLVGNTTFGTGRVGQGFVFDGSSDAVSLGNPASLQLQDFTIETWIRRASATVTSFDFNGGEIFGYGGGGYVLGMLDNGTPFLSRVEVDNVMPNTAITDTNLHHLAVTKLGNNVVFYVDGVAYFVPPYNTTYNFATPAAIGARGDTLANSFLGTIDEVSVYNRSLAINEIQAIYNAGSAGKCASVAPPSCTPSPAGLVSWWAAEGSAGDNIGNLNGALYGGTTFTPGKVGQAFSFDGIDDSITNAMSGLTNILDTYTMELWAWPTAGRASTPESTSGVDGHGNQRYAIFPHSGPTGGTVGAGISVGTNGVSVFEAGDTYLPALLVFDAPIIGWTHIAVVYTNRRPSLYVNGVMVRSGLTSVNPSCPSTQFGERGAASANQGYYAGLLDEVSIYNRALAPNEIQVLFNAGSSGKCFTPTSPSITAQPGPQTVTIGETATFNVTASGSAPLSYQWRQNSTNIAGATAGSLVITNVQPAAAGVYSVIVSNALGSVTSSNATLTVNTLAVCGAPPAGLVGWWRGENNPADQVGGNTGTLLGNTTYGAGRVSQAFVFDGSGDGVSLGNPPSLKLQDFTIETWIKRANTTVASFDFNGGSLFSHGGGGYSLGIQDNGTLFLSRVEVDAVFASTTITDTNLHHLAVTKLGTTVVFYVDGVAYPAPPYNTTFNFATAAAIGARGDNLANSFLGTIDEVSVYSRPLSAPEIQGLYTAGSSGKCLTAIPASIVTQPVNKTVLVGGSTTFSVTAGGTPPFSYQWQYNGTSIPNATNATLTLANVQASQAGNYAVLVGNAALPPVLSSNATLTVTSPVANVRLFGTNIVSGRPVTLPIRIAANGNENAVSFSLTYNTTRLNFRTVQLGDFPLGTLLFVNTSQTNLGRLGVTVALPSGATFAPGTQLLAGVTFDATISLSFAPTTTPVNFGDSPMVRGLTDVNALTLPATFTSGSVTLSGTDLEGDGSPRPGGSRSFTLNDWVQAGRFAAKLDLPSAGGEFQRADAAPRGTAGDGQIKVMDWVQAGRYFAGLDPLTAVGGPTLEVAPLGPLGPDPLRELRVTGSNAIQDVAVTVPVVLQAQGNENGVGFTVSFDPAALRYQTASLGSGAPGANLNLNTNQVASGKLGLVLVLPTGSSFTAGNRELAKISWLPTVVGSYPVTLSDQLVLRGVSDPAAIELPASYVAGTVVVNPHPTLLITHAGTNVALAWPAMAAGFNLQSSTNATVSGGWSDVLDTPQPEGDNLKVTLPLTDQTKYFRLRLP